MTATGAPGWAVGLSVRAFATELERVIEALLARNLILPGQLRLTGDLVEALGRADRLRRPGLGDLGAGLGRQQRLGHVRAGVLDHQPQALHARHIDVEAARRALPLRPFGLLAQIENPAVSAVKRVAIGAD